jgi:hypothetical protein
MHSETENAVIVNRVAQSSLITLNLEELKPTGERVFFDIKDQLFMGLILREKEFRDFIKSHDWSRYQNKYVAIGCSADAIIPVWAYMLIATKLAPVAAGYIFGTLAELEMRLYFQALDQKDWQVYKGQKIVLKGCGNVPTAVYVEATRRLQPVADKIMYGEPCSTVPIYKK